MDLPTYADVVSAAAVVHRYLLPTPLYEWPALSRLLGCRFYLKHENHTPTTAFKVRGGVYLVSRLPDELKRRGILGCTTGNHGQSLAYAARLFGVRCVLVVPRSANPDKLAAMRELGAELVEHGRDVHDMVLVSDDALREAVALLLRLTHNLAEGAGAAALAAALALRGQLAGQTVVGVLSGGNLDLRELPRILGRGEVP